MCIKGPAAKFAVLEPKPTYILHLDSAKLSYKNAAKSLLRFLNLIGLSPAIIVPSVLIRVLQTSASYPLTRLRPYLILSARISTPLSYPYPPPSPQSVSPLRYPRSD